MTIYTDNTITVDVKWVDCYLEKFKCIEVNVGSDLLWLKLKDGTNRQVPLSQVRWFSIDPKK